MDTVSYSVNRSGWYASPKNFRLLMMLEFELQSATDGQGGGSMTGTITQHTPASQFQQSTNSSTLGRPIFNSTTPIKNECRGKSRIPQPVR